MIVRVDGLTVEYDGIAAIRDVTLELRSGVLYGVIGPNGAGKSTLLKSLAGIVKPVKGAVYVDFKELARIPRRELARKVALAHAELPRGFNATVLDFVLTSTYPLGGGFVHREDELRAAEEALRAVDAVHLASRRLDELSSGELRRVIIASVLARKAKVLLLDEPTAFLDLKYQVEVMELLKRITLEKNLVTVIATHDLRLAAMYCDHLVMLRNGEVVAQGAPRDVLRKDLVASCYGVEVEVFEHPSAGIVVVPVRSIRAQRCTWSQPP